MTPCIAIARIAPRSAWFDKSRPVAELFLPLDPATYGRVVVWDGCHVEAESAYFGRTKPPRTPAERQAAANLVRRYHAFMASIPEADRQEVVEEVRLPRNWRRVAWA